MSAEENKAIVRRFINSYNKRDLDVFDELVAPDYIDHTHHQQGRKSLRHLFSLAFEAFPDWHEHIEDIIAEGDRVWVCVQATGTHTGEWNLSGVPLPPTGRKVTMRMVFIWRIENGRLAEGWEVDSDRGFLTQLGMIEFTEKGKKFFPEDSRAGK
jgi:C-1 hydroxylase